MRNYRSRSARPTRQWQGISNALNATFDGTVTKSLLLAFEAPTPGSLTSMPPEDVTLMRVLVDLEVTLTAAMRYRATLGLMVADVSWTPQLNFQDDADKRWLWTQTYGHLNDTVTVYGPAGVTANATTITSGVPREATRIDVAPRARLEQGKALYLVCYGSGAMNTVSTAGDMARVLWQRSRRA